MTRPHTSSARSKRARIKSPSRQKSPGDVLRERQCIYATLATHLFGELSPVFFGSFSPAFFSMMQVSNARHVTRVPCRNGCECLVTIECM